MRRRVPPMSVVCAGIAEGVRPKRTQGVIYSLGQRKEDGMVQMTTVQFRTVMRLFQSRPLGCEGMQIEPVADSESVKVATFDMTAFPLGIVDERGNVTGSRGHGA